MKFFSCKHRFAELLVPSSVLLDPFDIWWFHSKLACLKSLHIEVALPFHLSQNLLIILFIENKKNFKKSIASCWTASQRQMYSYGDYEISYWSGFLPWDKITFRFSGRGVMLFEDKHGFDLITLIPMCCLSPLVGLRVTIKMQIAGCFLY